jgi:hypothetical protein
MAFATDAGNSSHWGFESIRYVNEKDGSYVVYEPSFKSGTNPNTNYPG